ncbi:hypothetical protein LL912_11625 [Niabella sp. CC-SYL272]|uniref:hypothetical protein n=1 Tax=Niabella agricola TaxID=2891571 RepID=UPI001F423CCF|nr:hypothetical protein [Niabella agricola]MCF3109426.1 hypothetical protein [Niabella agricola]
MIINFLFGYRVKYGSELGKAVAQCTQQAIEGRTFDICFSSNGVRNSAFTDTGAA